MHTRARGLQENLRNELFGHLVIEGNLHAMFDRGRYQCLLE